MACWTIENYEYREHDAAPRGFRSAVSLHTHSSYSRENLAPLNMVVKLWFMRPLSGTLQRAFGLDAFHDLDYRDVRYYPPSTPEDVFRTEGEAARRLGFDTLLLGITDHDEIAGSLELFERRPADAHAIAVGEELSIRFQGHLFHLGVTGLPPARAVEIHESLQAAARENRLDDMFEMLRAAGCLTVLNHALLPWVEGQVAPAAELLRRYGWAIHALEYNGMRRQEENNRVVDLAKHVAKPLVGGGDSHMLLPSSTICISRASTYETFIEEVKAGRSVPLIKPDYFAPLRWKLFLRVLCFIAHYRQIAHFRGVPVREILERRRVLLDPTGAAARAFLRMTGALRLNR